MLAAERVNGLVLVWRLRRGGIDFSHQQDTNHTTRHNTYIEYSLPLLAEAADLQEELTGERPHVVEDNHSKSYTPLSSRLNFCGPLLYSDNTPTASYIHGRSLWRISRSITSRLIKPSGKETSVCIYHLRFDLVGSARLPRVTFGSSEKSREGARRDIFVGLVSQVQDRQILGDSSLNQIIVVSVRPRPKPSLPPPALRLTFVVFFCDSRVLLVFASQRKCSFLCVFITNHSSYRYTKVSKHGSQRIQRSVRFISTFSSSTTFRIVVVVATCQGGVGVIVDNRG